MDDLLVGRGDQLAALNQALAEVRGARGLVLIGEAGMGKSALLRTFLRAAADRGATVLHGAGLPTTGVQLPFAPVASVLRQLKDRQPERLLAITGPQARRLLSTVVPDLLPATPSSALDDLMPTSLARGRLLTVLCDVLLALAREGPTVLAIDDLQWVDPGTRAMLELLLAGPDHVPLLVLLALREPVRDPELRRWLSVHLSHRSLQPIPLGPLGDDHAARLIAAASDRPPDAARVADITRRSGGNPFHLIELARVAPGQLPASIRDVVQAEVEALSPDAKRVVQASAVAGRPVDLELLLSVLDPGTTEALSEAVASGVLRVDGEDYALSHELARDSVLETLLPGERVELHRRFGTALAALPYTALTAARLGEAAWHLHRGHAWSEALSWALRAATAAERAGAFAAAHHHLRRALQAADTLAVPAERRIELLVRAATAADREGAATDARDYVDAALRLQDPGQDPLLAARLLGHRGWIALVTEDSSRAWHYTAQALALLPADAPPAVRAEIKLRVSLVVHLTGDSPTACLAAREALTYARQAGDRRLVGRSLSQLANTQPAIDGWPLALRLLRQAWRYAVRSGDPDDLAQVAVSLTDHFLSAGRYDDAVVTAFEARQLLRQFAEGQHWLEPMIVAKAAEGLVRLGQWPQAQQWIDEVSPADPFGSSRLVCARLRMAQGRLTEANAELRSVAHLRRDDTPNFSLDFVEIAAERDLWAGTPDRALALAEQVLGSVPRGAARRRGRGLCVLGLRAAADLALGSRDRRDRSGVEQTVLRGRRLSERVTPVLEGDDELFAVAAAELSRLEGRPDVAAWQQVAGLWDDQVPLCGAYARWRLAQALLDSPAPRSHVAPVLHEARSLLEPLGSTVLDPHLTSLARHAGIALRPDPRPTPDPAAPRGPSLSSREAQVLRLVAQGRTNREIGTELYLSPKTVSVHVTHLMQKLGVSSRVQAAALAHRLGLDTGLDTDSSPPG